MSKTKEEIIKGHYTCTCNKIYTSRNMVDPSCVLHEHGGEIELIMQEYAVQEMAGFVEWVEDEVYTRGINGNWIDHKYEGDYTTDQLIQLYFKQKDK